MLIDATWQIVFGSLPLLASGEATEGEPVLTRAQATDITTAIGADFAEPEGRGNVIHTVAFVRHVEHATPAIARAWNLSHLLALPVANAAHNLVITDLDSAAVKTFSNAVLTAQNLTVQNCTSVISYTLTAGAIS